MPRAPRHCGHPDCLALAYPPSRYCDDHSRDSIGWNKSPRTASSTRTSTRSWRRRRAEVLQRDNHMCVVRGPNCTVTASEVDHVIPVFMGGDDQPSNCQSVCANCHRDRTQAQAKAARG